MNFGRMVFAQLRDHLPSYEFQKCVTRYRGDYQQKTFSCWDQYLSMAFAQLTYRDSLRDIEVCLRSMQGKLYHMGFAARWRAPLSPMPTRHPIGESMQFLPKY